MKLPTQPAQYDRYIEQQRSGVIEREFLRLEQAIPIRNGYLVLGNYRIWVDATGKLRLKDGIPTSDTDGTVVGTQT